MTAKERLLELGAQPEGSVTKEEAHEVLNMMAAEYGPNVGEFNKLLEHVVLPQCFPKYPSLAAGINLYFGGLN